MDWTTLKKSQGASNLTLFILFALSLPTTMLFHTTLYMSVRDTYDYSIITYRNPNLILPLSYHQLVAKLIKVLDITKILS